MVVEAARKNLRIKEVPITYSAIRESHLLNYTHLAMAGDTCGS